MLSFYEQISNNQFLLPLEYNFLKLKSNRQLMLTVEEGNALKLIDPIAKTLTHFCFAKESPLWKKQKHFKHLKSEDLRSKRYEFSKIGKILGLQTTRYLCQSEGCLFYFNDILDEQYLGFCKLQNVYIQWLRMSQNKYLLVISNAIQKNYYFFAHSDFWKEQKEEIIKYAIQVDFYDKFQIVDLLGQGTFSKVHKVRSLVTGEFLAAKFINKIDKNQESTKQLAVSQRRILRQFKNDKMVATFKEFYQTKESFIILMEYIPGRDMMSYFIQRQLLGLNKLKKIFVDILNILRECHQKNIIHRDIKPQNIILQTSDLQPRLIDFGLSIVTNYEMESYSYSKCGTLGYIAPEVLHSESMYYKSYGCKCDIYSFGIIVHMFLMGYNPVMGKSVQETKKKSRQSLQLNEKQIIDKYGKPCLHFLKRLLAINHKQRYTAQQALNSSFLRDCSDSEGSTSTYESNNRRSDIEERSG